MVIVETFVFNITETNVLPLQNTVSQWPGIKCFQMVLLQTILFMFWCHSK